MLKDIYCYLNPEKWSIIDEKKYVEDIPKYGKKKALLCLIGVKIDNNNNRTKVIKYLPEDVYNKIMKNSYKLSTAGFMKGIFVFDEEGKVIDDLPMWYKVPDRLYDINISELPVLD